MVFKNPALSPRRVIAELLAALLTDSGDERVLPTPPYFTIRDDRYMPLDFSKVDTARFMDALTQQITEKGRPAVGAQLDSILARIERSARRIVDRGGNVVFVHFPHCGEIRELEEGAYPRPEYWNRLEDLGTGKAIHTADYPSLNHFDCPDGSHLDVADAGPFTRAVARIVERPLGARIPNPNEARQPD
jgi:hypothetical protein